MIIKDILVRCNQEGVELSLNDDNLSIAFDDYPSEELLDLLRNNKQSIILHISQRLEKTVAQRPELRKSDSPYNQVYSSFPQEMLWFMSELGGAAARYNMIYTLKVKGELNVHSAEQAFTRIIERHLPLRTNFKANAEGEISPFLNSAIDFKIEMIDINETNSVRIAESLRAFKHSFTSRQFSLAHNLLLQVAYVKLSDAEGVLFINMHHIASDGWSLGILVNEFKQLYLSNSSGFENQLIPLEYSYSDYAYWQRHCMTDIHEKQLVYWQSALRDLPSLHSLPTDMPRPLVQEFSGRSYSITLSESKLLRLNELAAENSSTLFMVFHAAFALLLSKFSYTEDVVIGTLLANRVDKHLEPLIGFFANTVVLRTQVDSTLSFSEFLSQVKQVNLSAQDNQDVPFEKVVERINPNRSQSHTPLCQVMLAFDNTPKAEFKLSGVEFFEEELEEHYALFDLFLKIYQRDEQLSLCFNYSTSLFEASSIIQMADALINLVDNILHNPNAPISELSCLPILDSKQLSAVSEGENILIDSISQIQTLFEQQVIDKPNQVALRFGDVQLTYNELNTRSNQLAYQLREQGVTSDSIVALYCERSIEMVVGIFGILKSGASYLPLEPSNPVDRLSYMLENSGCKIVLLPDFIETRACFEDSKCIRFSATDTYNSGAENPELLTSQNKDSLAYIIYTSGSTGLPKGVMITHESLINRIHWMQNRYKLTDRDTVLQKTPFSFDVSVWEFMWPLSYGGCLDVLPPDMHRDPDYLLKFIEQHQITILHFVPSMFRYILGEYAQRWSVCKSIKHVFSSGEALPLDLVIKHQSLNSAKLHNLYGPTEASIDVSFYCCDSVKGSGIPIGKAIQNTQLYILDNHERTLPQGAIGELYISGLGLARGYINNAELTNSKFIYKQDENGRTKRLYKTGDLVRSDANGDIHYFGRLDNQVKIRGFRVELSEIEQSLLRLSEVRAAVVTCHKDRSGTTLLIAYVVLDAKDGNDRDQVIGNLSHFLQNTLPSYMLPTAYIPISEVPVTSNGKLNTSALPSWNTFLESATNINPRTETEITLANIWSEVLGMDAQVLSVDKSFFSFGGNSLNLIRLKSKIESEFLVDIPTAKLFDTDTIMKQAELVEVFLLSTAFIEESTDVFVEEI